MNILFICDEYPPGKIGGIGSVVSTLAKAMNSRGHKIFVVGLYTPGYNALEYEEFENIRIWRFRYTIDYWRIISGNDSFKDKIITRLLRLTGIFNLDAQKQFKKMMAFIDQLITHEKIDVIEMPDWNNFFFNLKLKHFHIPRFSVPLTLKCHGTLSYFNTTQNLPVPSRMKEIESHLIKNVDALSAVSKYTANAIKQIYDLEQNIEILYNGVDLRVPVSVKLRDKFKVVFTGSLVHKKGIYSLLKAWKLVKNKIPQATLHVYGKGNIDKAKTFIDKSVENSIVFYGHVNREVLLTELEKCTLAVFPSYSETFGLGVVEAMSCGCPVIYTQRTCGPEIVLDGVEGILVDPDNVQMIADQISSLLLDTGLREKLSIAASTKVADCFNIDTIVKNHIAFYERTISNFRANQHTP